jgi:hypothetical protein
VFVALVPFFACGELTRIIGGKRMWAIFLGGPARINAGQ